MPDIAAVTLRFTVNRSPVSVNATYKRGRGNRLYMSSVAKDFKESVRAHAVLAKLNLPSWPHPSNVRAVALSIVTWNTRHDADGPVKLISDALEGIVYANDRCVRSVAASKDADFSKRRRVEITVELLELA